MFQRILVFCYIWLNVIIRAKSKTVITSPSIQPVYLKSGGDLDLLCQQSDGFKVVWWKADASGPSHDYKLLDSSLESGYVTLAHIDGMYYMRLSKANVQPSDSGSYKCSVQSGTDMPFMVDVYVLKVERHDGLITHAGNTTSVGCSLLDSDIKATIRWFKSDVEVASSQISPVAATTPAPRYSKYQVNTTLRESSVESFLTIRNIGESDVGEYVCMIELNEDYHFNHSVNLYSYPQIKSLGRSVNLAEGKALDLNCKAWGWPTPNVTWVREDEGEDHYSLEEDEWRMDERVSFPTGTSLRIDPVVSGDRAFYVCRATSSVNDTMPEITVTSTILVRVRGRFAPLLPLAGILIEVIILVVVIFLYERKRAIAREEQERGEMLGNQSNSIAQGHRHSSSGEGGGRHRKLR